MIDSAKGHEKSSNDYLESIRQQLGLGHSDKATRRVHKKELGKNDFIKLMSVQLQNQDPTSPLKNEEMAAQLAQFSALEQMQNVNTTLEKMSNETKSRDNLMASQFIGKEVVTDSSRFEIDEDRRADLKFNLKGDIEKGTIAILDDADKVIREMEIGKLKEGENTIKWDGRDRLGVEARVGAYKFRVTAYDKADAPVKAETGSKGMVAGVEFEKGQPVLLVEGKRLPLNEISKIQDPLVSKMIEAMGQKESKKAAPEAKDSTSAIKNGDAMKGAADEAARKAMNSISNSAAVKAPTEPQKAQPSITELAKKNFSESQGTKNAGLKLEPQEGLEGMKLFDPTGIGI